MKLTPARLALGLLLIWEVWWAYDYYRAPVPDYEMRKVFALFLGIAGPFVATVAYLLFVGVAALATRIR